MFLLVSAAMLVLIRKGTSMASPYKFLLILGKHFFGYSKIPKINPGLIFFKGPFWGAYIRRGLSTEGNLRFKIDWASLIVGLNLPFLLCFFFCIWGKISKYKPPGDLYLEGRFNGGFSVLPAWGAYIWRGLYMEGLIFEILRDHVYEILLWPESWRGSLYIYLLSFAGFWTLSIERFRFLFWSILNCVTLKTSN